MNDKPNHPYKNSLGEHVISGIPNDVFNLSRYDLKKLYFNDLLPAHEDIPKHPFTMDGIEYRFNKNGYRSPEFNSDIDLLISGCSFTYGVGVKQEDVWATLVGEKLKIKYANLAIPGNSVGKIVRDIYAYFKQFGHPKVIFCLFPPFERIEIPINEKLITINRWEEIKKRRIHEENDHNNYYIQSVQLFFSPDLKMVSKKPYFAEQTIPTDMAHFYAAQDILMLEQYCKTAGIKFMYAFWNPEQYVMINKLREIDSSYYNNVIDVETGRWKYDQKSGKDCLYEKNIYMVDFKNWGNIIDCHSEIRNDNITFDIAADRHEGDLNAHWGSHRHIHIAEVVHNNLKEML